MQTGRKVGMGLETEEEEEEMEGEVVVVMTRAAPRMTRTTTTTTTRSSALSHRATKHQVYISGGSNPSPRCRPWRTWIYKKVFSTPPPRPSPPLTN